MELMELLDLTINHMQVANCLDALPSPRLLVSEKSYP
jgi:hypothetical protein